MIATLITLVRKILVENSIFVEQVVTTQFRQPYNFLSLAMFK